MKYYLLGKEENKGFFPPFFLSNLQEGEKVKGVSMLLNIKSKAFFPLFLTSLQGGKMRVVGMLLNKKCNKKLSRFA